jgi:hypothetical protein
MAWVEVEEDVGAWFYVGCYLAFAAGLAVWWWRGFAAGLAIYLGVGCAAVLGRQLWLQMVLPREARQAARVVLAWFRERYPEERVEGVAVRAIEPQRFVIAVRHGCGRPTPRRYFAVSRPGLTGITELERADWWPRGLK